MRKITTAITAILLAAMMTAGISAYDAETAEKQADALNEMGLFKGTDNGYDLENVPTRAQSSVMLVRFLGKEEEAMGLEYTAPFNDVADWAKPYIQYLWQNGLANGYGDGRYGADDPCTAQMYATIVLRVLGYSDKEAKDFTYDKAIEFATEKGLDCPAEGFLRGDMVEMTYSALSLETADGKKRSLSKSSLMMVFLLISRRRSSMVRRGILMSSIRMGSSKRIPVPSVIQFIVRMACRSSLRTSMKTGH